MLVTDFFDYFQRLQPAAACLQQDQRHLSYAQFNTAIDALVNGLLAAGTRHGDRVAILSANAIEQLTLFYACARIGAVYLPLNFRLAAQEIAYILADSGAQIIFVGGDELADTITRAAQNAGNGIDGLTKVWIGDVARSGWTGYADFVAAGADVAASRSAVLETDTVYQMYTSGTTGLPKGVMISHRQLASFICAYAIMPPRRQAGEPHLAVAPLFHAAAFSLVLAALSCGRPVVIMAAFDPVRVIDILAAKQVADTLLVPAMLQAVVDVNADRQVPLPALRAITYGGSPISASQLARAVAVMGCEFQQGFGMTEMVTGVVWLTPDDHRRALTEKPELLQSCGRPAPFNEVKIVDPETGLELAAGAVGEIVLRGAQMMQGYWQQPEKTAEAIRAGWYHSGDAGYLDEEGFLYIKDRIKDMVVTGGENVYPAEVEAALMAHPQLCEVAVIGVADEKYGEALLALCVGQGEEPTTEELIAFCRERIAGYKIPRRYVFVPALPRNAAGKILRRQLREQFSIAG